MPTRKLKVLHIVESFAGGVFDFIRDLVDGMPEYEHVIVHGMREYTPKNYEELIKASAFIKIENFQREISLLKDYKALLEIVSILKNFKNDRIVIHLHSSKAGFIGRVACKILKLNDLVIYTPHGASFLRKDVSDLKRKTYVLLEKIAVFCGGLVVACSQSEANEFKKYGIDAVYINNGVEDFSKIFEKEFKREEKENKKIVVGNSGRIVEQKNPRLFNHIAEEFIKNKEVEFLWIGDGPLKNELTSPNIKITGWLNREKAMEYLYGYVDIYLSTSLWEGLPLNVLQAMSFKKPLVLHRCVGNVDLVRDNVNGFIFDTKEQAVEAINELISDENKRRQYGENSYKIYVNEFSIEKMISEYRNLYENLAQ